jgi:hypothetical protein
VVGLQGADELPSGGQLLVASGALVGGRGVAGERLDPGLLVLLGLADAVEADLAPAGGLAPQRPRLALDGRVEPGERVAGCAVALDEEDERGLERVLGVLGEL